MVRNKYRTKRNKLWGHFISVVDNRTGWFADSDEKWFTVCEKHSELCSHKTRKLADYHSVIPEWCSGCAPKVHAYFARQQRRSL